MSRLWNGTRRTEWEVGNAGWVATVCLPGRLVVFCGLPGVGKTAISRRVADRLGATFLRIDTRSTTSAKPGKVES